MATDNSKPKSNPIVGKIVKDPKSPPNALCLRGFVGDSSEEKSIRLYFNPDFSDYVDVPEDAVLHSEPVPEAWSPFGAMYVWIERDAELMHGSERIKANFMQGRIFQQQAGAQAAAAAQAQVQPQAVPFPGGGAGGAGGPGGFQFTPLPTPPFVCPPSPPVVCPPSPPAFCPPSPPAFCPPSPPAFCPPSPPVVCPPSPPVVCPPSPPAFCPPSPPVVCPPSPPVVCPPSPPVVCPPSPPAFCPPSPPVVCPPSPPAFCPPSPPPFCPLPFGQEQAAQPFGAQPQIDPRAAQVGAAAAQPGLQQPGGAVIDQQHIPASPFRPPCPGPVASPPFIFCPPPITRQFPCPTEIGPLCGFTTQSPCPVTRFPPCPTGVPPIC